jgi:hypothetical protein
LHAGGAGISITDIIIRIISERVFTSVSVGKTFAKRGALNIGKCAIPIVIITSRGGIVTASNQEGAAKHHRSDENKHEKTN